MVDWEWQLMTSGGWNTVISTAIVKIDGGRIVVNIMEETGRKVLTSGLKSRKIKLRAAIIGRDSP